MTQAQANRRERALEWITASYLDGARWAETLRSGVAAERELVLAKLEAYARAERRRGLAGDWTYDLARHTELVRIIEQERALLTAEDLRAARCRHQVEVRRVRHLLHRRGFAPLSALRRLGTARGAFLAAIARKDGDAR
jgi:hypothetical protein